MLPLPLAVNPEAPPLPTAVNVSLLIPVGTMSVTVAPVTPLGPLLLTTMVYVVDPPGVAPATPSLLVIARSATPVIVSVSVGLLLVATIVYTVLAPALTLVTPSVLVMARSACGVNVSVSVAVLFARLESVTPTGAVTVAVFATLPVALELTLAWTV